jgi:hypothetical protein
MFYGTNTWHGIHKMPNELLTIIIGEVVPYFKSDYNVLCWVLLDKADMP